MQEQSPFNYIYDNQIETIIKEKTVAIPGLAIAFSNQGKISTKEFGKTDRDSPIDVNAKTIFGTASLSKPVFIILVLKLIAANKLNAELDFGKFILPPGITHFDLDTPLHQILPNERLKGNKFAEKLTTRMILSHLTGLPIFDKDFGKKIKNLFELEFEPGTQYSYSGIAIMYLQEVIAKLIPQASLESLSRKFIFDPLQMHNSTFYQEYDLRLMSDLESNMELIPWTIYLNQTETGFEYKVIGLDGIVKHGAISRENLPEDFPENVADIIQAKEKWLPTILSQTCRANHTTAPENAANSFFTTPYDYMLLVNACMNDGTLEDIYKPAVSMTTDEWAKCVGVPVEDLKQVAWGMCFGLELDGNEVVSAYHSGDMNEWRAWVAINLKNKTAIVYFANGHNGHVLADHIITPFVKLEHALHFFSEKYGFAIKFEPDWDKKEQARFNKIGAYLNLPDWQKKLISSIFNSVKNNYIFSERIEEISFKKTLVENFVRINSEYPLINKQEFCVEVNKILHMIDPHLILQFDPDQINDHVKTSVSLMIHQKNYILLRRL